MGRKRTLLDGGNTGSERQWRPPDQPRPSKTDNETGEPDYTKTTASWLRKVGENAVSLPPSRPPRRLYDGRTPGGGEGSRPEWGGIALTPDMQHP